MWISSYFEVAALFAAGCFATADTRPAVRDASVSRPVSIAVCAAILWPVLILGLAQLAVLVAAGRLFGPRRRTGGLVARR